MITARMKELLLLMSICSMITLGLGTQTVDNSDKYASGEESDEEAGPAPEDEGEGESKTKDKDRSNAEQQPPDGTLALEASSQASEVSASSVGVYGDFNNDGFDDLAVGVNQDVGDTFNAGAVNVLYGGASGLQTSAPADQLWYQNSSDESEGIEDGDNFGFALAAGDFNNDGFDDLAVGVPQEDVGAIIAAGAVNVLYGGAAGLQTSAPADQFWNQDSPGVNGVAEGFDNFGSALG